MPPANQGKVFLSLQCSEGRFEQYVDAGLTIREVKKHFKQMEPKLWDVNTNGYVVFCDGEYFTDESVSLKDLSFIAKESEESSNKTVGKPSATFILLKRSACLFLNKGEERAEN